MFRCRFEKESFWIAKRVLLVSKRSPFKRQKDNYWKTKGVLLISLGRDKLKNASILRKYGSICMDEKTKAFIRIIYSTVNVVTFIPFFVFS